MPIIPPDGILSPSPFGSCIFVAPFSFYCKPKHCSPHPWAFYLPPALILSSLFLGPPAASSLLRDYRAHSVRCCFSKMAITIFPVLYVLAESSYFPIKRWKTTFPLCLKVGGLSWLPRTWWSDIAWFPRLSWGRRDNFHLVLSLGKYTVGGLGQYLRSFLP